MLGYIDPNITVNIIEDGTTVEKKRLELPEKIVNVVKCKNPRCITSVEQELPQEFVLTDRESGLSLHLLRDAGGKINGTQESPRLRRGLSCRSPRLPPPLHILSAAQRFSPVLFYYNYVYII